MSRFASQLTSHAFIACTAAFLLISLSCSRPAAAQKQSPAARVETLKASDGIDLKVSYFAAAKPGPGILLLHQCNQQRKMWDGLAAQLAAAGLNVLTLDYRGFGESGGARFDQLKQEEAAKTVTQKWPDDIDVALAYLVTHQGVTRNVIGAGGASCGVDQAIQLARRHEEVKSLVLLSGNTNHDGREFLRTAANLPIFFGVAADDDPGRATPVMQWLAGIAVNPGDRFAHYSTGGHGIEMIAAHPELASTIVDWFATTLVKTPGHAPAGAARSMPASQVGILEEIDEPGGAARAAKTLANARAQDPKAELFPEVLVNLLGYEHLAAGDMKGAIEIMKLNAAAYPKSANTYDSLSDAYLADGQKNLAHQKAQKALELLPADTTLSEQRRKGIRDSAEQKLKQLGNAPK